MAIIDDHKVEASILINGTPAREYDDPEFAADEEVGHDNPIRCSKYIECVDGAEFSVFAGLTGEYPWLNQRRDCGLTFRVYVDGKHVVGRICENSILHGHKWRTEFRGHENHDASSGGLLRRFKFAPVHTVDNADSHRTKMDMKRAENLGSIEVIIRRVTVGEVIPNYHCHTAEDGEFSISEKALKGRAVSHGTSYSAAEPIVKNPPLHCTNQDVEPIAIFTFKYRSRDALREEMVIPRSPSPDLQLNGLAPGEITRLAQERLSQIKKEEGQKRQRSIKREHSQVYDLTGDVGPSRPLKISKLDNGKDLVDLTDD